MEYLCYLKEGETVKQILEANGLQPERVRVRRLYEERDPEFQQVLLHRDSWWNPDQQPEALAFTPESDLEDGWEVRIEIFS